MNKYKIYKAVSDLIAKNYEWLSHEKRGNDALQYILGINDFARYLCDLPEEEEYDKRESTRSMD